MSEADADGGRVALAPPPGAASISVHGLTKRYGEVEAVRGIDFDVAAGEIFGFLGPNGAGKSTTISMLCTLVKPTSGTATVAGFDVNTQRDAVRRPGRTAARGAPRPGAL